MLHTLVTVIGTGSSRNAAVEEVVSAGGATTEDGARLIWAVADDLPGLEALSRRHPRVTFGVEAFEEFGDEMTRLVIVDGSATELSRSPLLDHELFGSGSVNDEDGARSDPSELRRAGRMILYREPATAEPGASPLAVSMTMARSLGRFAEHTRGWQDNAAPGVEALQAVADLGDAAASLCIGTDHACSAEREHHRAMTLTRAVLLAGRESLDDADDDAHWDEWLGDLLADCARVMLAAYECGRCDKEGCRCHEALGLAAIPLLTICLQTLATFQPLSAPLP